MTLASNREEAEQLDRLSRYLLSAQRELGAVNVETALLAFRLARQELDAVIHRLEGR